MLRCHIGGDSNNTSFFNPLKAKIKRGFIAPVYRGDNTDSLGCPVGAAPTVAERIVKLHQRVHLQVDAEIRRKHGAVPAQFLDIGIRIFPYQLEFLVI